MSIDRWADKMPFNVLKARNSDICYNFLYFKKYFYRIVGLQCCVNLCRTVKWGSYTYTCILFMLFPIMVYHRMLIFPVLCSGTLLFIQTHITTWQQYKWSSEVKSLSRVRIFATLWTVAYQAPPSVGFSRQEYWSGLPLVPKGQVL